MSAQRILVVDDDKAIREMVGLVLSEEGFDVKLAANGIQAVEMFEAAPFEVVFTDIRMPGMSGIELLSKLVVHTPGVHVIVMTSHASVDNCVQALKAGAYDYLIKPFEDLGLIAQAAKRACDNIALTQERDLLIASLTRQNRELDKLNRFFRDLAVRDGLTGLHNHRYAQEALRAEIARANRYQRPLSVLFIDVDHFKQYNDVHGHQNGDTLLNQLGTLFDSQTRELDVVARWGGEEFIIIAPETDSEQASHMASKLISSVKEHPFAGREKQPLGHISVSVGIAGLSEELSDSTSLVGAADQALYAAKAGGRNRYCIAGVSNLDDSQVA